MLSKSVHVVKLYTIYTIHFLQFQLPSPDSPSIMQSLYGSTPKHLVVNKILQSGSHVHKAQKSFVPDHKNLPGNAGAQQLPRTMGQYKLYIYIF